MTTDWYSDDKLKQAWKYAKSDIRDDFIFDVINNDDISNNINHVITSIRAQIKANQYYPAPIIRIGVPKNYHSVRPGTVISPIDLIVLYAIAQRLAPLLDPHLSDSAYAYRLNSKAGKSGEHLFTDKEEPLPEKENTEVVTEEVDLSEVDVDFPSGWFVNWKAFDSQSKEASQKFQHVAITDITAYFENISLDLLREILKEKLNTDERELIDRLFRAFEYWDWTPNGNLPQGIGLIQGNDVSSFLSNLYLLDLDTAMLNVVNGDHSKYFRYVDDVKLFTNDEDEARLALVKLEEVLRSLNLNVQSAKTKIKPSSEIRDSDVDLWLEKMSDDNPEKLAVAIEFFETVFKSDDLDKWQRPYSRCLTILKQNDDDRAVPTSLEMFLANPSQRLLVKNFSYLLRFAHLYEYEPAILKRIQSGTFTFPYHKAFMYRLAAYGRHEIDELKIAALQDATNLDSHWFCRMAALFLLSTFALEAKELAQVENLINIEANSQVMRAAFVLLLQQSGNELHWVFDKLSLFNAPHQDFLKRYFFQLARDTKLAENLLFTISKATISAPTFISNLYKLDIMKSIADVTHRTKFKEVIEKKIRECNPEIYPRLHNRLRQIYNAFVVKAG